MLLNIGLRNLTARNVVLGARLSAGYIAPETFSRTGARVFPQLQSRTRTMSSSTAQISSTTLPLANLPPILHKLHQAKAQKGLTFADIGKACGRDECWVAALFYAQAKPVGDDFDNLSKVLGVDSGSIKAELGDHWFPNRGDPCPVPPKDATLYRLFEGVLVYGHAIKAVIHEKFGDGIMSMIDCKVTVDKKPDPKGDRVILTFDGKFLPYIKW